MKITCSGVISDNILKVSKMSRKSRDSKLLPKQNKDMVDLDTIKEMRKLDELEIADQGERNKALLIEFDELKKN